MTQELEGSPYMGVARVGLMHCDPCRCKVKGFLTVSSIERNVSKRGTCKGCDNTGGKEGYNKRI